MKLEEMLEFAGKFHGHVCPGLAVGCVASSIALREARRSEDEELVAVVENSSCSVDAIQALTGCTFGKGNLIHKDYGKSVYTFFNRNTGKAVRLSLKPDVFDDVNRDGAMDLFTKVREGTASGEELERFNSLWRERSYEIIRKGDSIFNVEKIDAPFPEKAMIFESIPCDACGGQAMATRIIERGGKRLCIPCSEKTEQG